MARIDDAARRYVRTDPDFPLNATIDNDGDNPVPVSGPLTDTQLRAADVKITLDGEKIISDQLPASLGAKTAAESLPVTLSTDGAFSQNFGAKADSPASSDDGAFSHIALLKRLLAKFPASLGAKTAAESLPVTLSTDGAFSQNFGAKADSPASSDDGAFSHIALLKRLLAKFPTSLGSNGGLKVETNGGKNTASVARVSASATVVTLLAANANRRRVIIYNDSTAVLRVKLGSAASATDYTYRLGAGDTYESPTDWVYTGIVTGIWDSATGAAQVTEI